MNKKDTTKAATHTPGASRTSPLFGRSRTIPSRVSAMPASVIKTAVFRPTLSIQTGQENGAYIHSLTNDQTVRSLQRLGSMSGYAFG